MALVADIFKCLLIDSDGEVIAHDQLSEANISVDTETNDVIAGRNELIAVLHGRREIEISLTTPIFNFEALAKHVGTDIVTGAGTAYAMPKWYDVEGGKITLDKTPLEGTVKVYDEDGESLAPVTVTGAEVELPIGTSDKVQVRTYQYATPAGTQSIDIDSTKFPKDVMIVLETLEIGDDEQTMSYLQFEYPRVKPSANFAINTSSSREANSNEMTFRVMKPKTSEKIGVFKRFPVQE